MRLDGWDVWFVRVPFGVACFVNALPELMLLSREQRAVKLWVGKGKVPLVVTSCTSAR